MNDHEQNKLNAQAFNLVMFNDRCPREAVAKFVGNKYLQHNPHVGDGKEAFIDYFDRMTRDFPGGARTLPTRDRGRELRRPALLAAVARR